MEKPNWTIDVEPEFVMELLRKLYEAKLEAEKETGVEWDPTISFTATIDARDASGATTGEQRIVSGLGTNRQCKVGYWQSGATGFLRTLESMFKRDSLLWYDEEDPWH